jgi:hypothetical protein
MHRSQLRRLTAIVAATGALMLPAITPLPAQPRGGDGYLFERPRLSLALRVGAARPNAAGDLFDFISRQLTVDRGDYLAPAFSTEMGWRVSDHAELMLGLASSHRRIGSEYRAFVDNEDQPIEQRTAFSRTPLTVGLKWHLTPVGRSVSRLVWIPTRVVPFVAIGSGVTHYRLAQRGDFIDFRTSDVFSSTLAASGWSPSAYGAAGIVWNVAPSVGLTTELRYDAAHGSPGRDFDGFDRINLSGAGVTAGLVFRF